jgi:hypothetical protein
MPSAQFIERFALASLGCIDQVDQISVGIEFIATALGSTGVYTGHVLMLRGVCIRGLFWNGGAEPWMQAGTTIG